MSRPAFRTATVARVSAQVQRPPSEVLRFDFAGRPAAPERPREKSESIKESIVRWLEEQL